MIFTWSNSSRIEDEEEEEGESDLNDALLDELDAEDLADDELLDGVEPPVIPLVDAVEEEEEGEDETARAFFDDEDADGDEDVDPDYDSFDDKDDL